VTRRASRTGPTWWTRRISAPFEVHGLAEADPRVDPDPLLVDPGEKRLQSWDPRDSCAIVLPRLWPAQDETGGFMGPAAKRPETACSCGFQRSEPARPTGFEPVTFGFVDETALGAHVANVQGF